jgi:uracil-DNA glycosylase
MLENAPSWHAVLSDQFEQPYMQALVDFLQEQERLNKTIYPPFEQRFAALEVTPLDNVKVVILGQDPYHQPDQAHGLCFSVQPGIKPPPSLVNIYKELKTDLDIEPVSHGYLEAWAEQGVLLLNSVLTVEQSEAGSHQGRGWELFTDQVIRVVNERCENVVFMLWGGYAQKKGKSISRERHLVLTAPHPSPLSSYRGFFGCKHFSQANEYLSEHGRPIIQWQLPELA